jgi:HME family heavy-metal exporter
MFNTLVETSLKNRLLVLVLSVALSVIGAVALTRTPVDVFPSLDKPTITLMTEAGGMAPEEVEQLITFPLETAMNGMPGVTSVRSISSVGLSFVYVQFDFGIDIFRARQMVAERLVLVGEQMPEGVNPAMGPISSIMGEIMLIAIPLDPQKIGAMQVREYADFVLRPRLLTIPGVAQVVPIGGEVRQFQVQPNTARMAQLNVTIENLEAAMRNFSANTSGGFLELNSREYLIRNLGRTSKLEDLQKLPVAYRNGQLILLAQVAEVTFAPAIKRGDAGYNGRPAVILGVQKQPDADTVKLTRTIETALAAMAKGMPAGMDTPRLTMRQATFIEASISTLQGKLLAAGLVVGLVLYAFLMNLRTTLISLTAIPVSVLMTVLVFSYFGLSINTMTLGGLTIAIGALVDDAVVGVENVLRRLKKDREFARSHHGIHLRASEVIAKATMEVRSAIVYATLIIVLVLVPLFFLPGLEGRLLQPLAVAYIVSLLASMGVSVTLTPVMAYYLLPKMKGLDDGDTRLQAWIKARYRTSLEWVLARPKQSLAVGVLAVLIAGAAVPFFARSFLPPFNEGTTLIGLRLNPGTTLAESVRIAQSAERALQSIPEVEYVGRRSGRAELDEHAEGVHVSELDVGLKRTSRSVEAIYADIRTALAPLPAAISIGQPISHRIDHMLTGVRTAIAIKIYGDDLDTLRAQAETLRGRLIRVRGVADLEVEKQVLTPQIKVRIDYDAAAQYGLAPGKLLAELQMMIDGEKITQIVEGNRRFNLVMRLPEEARGLEGLRNLMLDTPAGRLPLSQMATIEESDGPNQISRDDGRRRIVVMANAQGRALSDVVADIRTAVADLRLPEGYFITVGGQFEAQEQASRLIGLLSLLVAAAVFMILYSRYQSGVLAAIIMVNIPLALVGSVIGLALAQQPLSVAALVGFITLAGIAVRNGILKVSHYINLCAFENESFERGMIVRGSLERLTPVLMTALVAALALAPLLFEADQAGTEILHPVAVVIFAGLISSTLLDSYLTPAMFWLFGRKPLEKLLDQAGKEAF